MKIKRNHNRPAWLSRDTIYHSSKITGYKRVEKEVKNMIRNA
jgi:hypothetical protein